MSVAVKEWWQRSTADELRPTPWLHPGAVRILEGLLRPDMRVLEHGSGGSTLWLATRVRGVLAIESSSVWHERVSKLAPGNVNIILCHSYPNSLEGMYDLMLVDGEPVETRALYLDRAEHLVRPGGWVVLDNANRPEYAQGRAEMRQRCNYWMLFHWNHPIVHFSETEFYRLKGGSDESG